MGIIVIEYSDITRGFHKEPPKVGKTYDGLQVWSNKFYEADLESGSLIAGKQTGPKNS